MARDLHSIPHRPTTQGSRHPLQPVPASPSPSGSAAPHRDGEPLRSSARPPAPPPDDGTSPCIRPSLAHARRPQWPDAEGTGLEAAALRWYAAELARRNEDLSRLVFAASHNLREPLRTVTSYVQLLAKHYGADLGPDAAEYIAFAVDGARRLSDQLDGLLDYARMDAQILPRATVDVNVTMAEAVDSLRGSISAAEATVTYAALPTIVAVPSEVLLLFQHLLGNALKFRGESPPRIVVGARRRRGGWAFFVRDNGIGVDPRYQDQLFALFGRLHPYHSYAGAGVGLATCKRIVERLGGTIWVESIEGKGATFWFTVPQGAVSPTTLTLRRGDVSVGPASTWMTFPAGITAAPRDEP